MLLFFVFKVQFSAILKAPIAFSNRFNVFKAEKSQKSHLLSPKKFYLHGMFDFVDNSAVCLLKLVVVIREPPFPSPSDHPFPVAQG